MGRLATAVLAAGAAGCGANQRGLISDAEPPPPNVDRDDAGTPEPEPDPDPPATDAAMPPPRLDGGAVDARKPPADTGPRPACTFGHLLARHAMPEVVIVFDRSGAMNKPAAGGAATRWTEMTAALDASVMKTQAGVSWGLKLFPNTATCVSTNGLDVDLGLSNYNTILTRIRGMMPSTSTDAPTGDAIRTVQATLAKIPSPNPRFIVLATDGQPGCPAGMGTADAVSTIGLAAMAGIHTYVVGTNGPGSTAHNTLNALAAAGREANAGVAQYFVGESRGQMLSALETITQRLTSCVLTTDVPAPAPNFVAMDIEHSRVPRDTQQREGWNWGRDFKTVHLYGTACTYLQTNSAAPVEMIYGCMDIPPP